MNKTGNSELGKWSVTLCKDTPAEKVPWCLCVRHLKHFLCAPIVTVIFQNFLFKNCKGKIEGDNLGGQREQTQGQVVREILAGRERQAGIWTERAGRGGEKWRGGAGGNKRNGQIHNTRKGIPAVTTTNSIRASRSK